MAVIQGVGVLAVVIAAAFALRYWLRLLYTAFVMLRGTNIRDIKRLDDVPLPEPLVPLAEILDASGFMYSYTVRYRVAAFRTPSIAWFYRLPDMNISLGVATTNSTPPFRLSMETYFVDGALLVTSYPDGPMVETPKLLARFAKHSFETALDHHLMTQFEWMNIHGDPIPLPDASTGTPDFGHHLMKPHRSRLYRWLVRQHIGHAISFAGFFMAGAYVALDWLAHFEQSPAFMTLLLQPVPMIAIAVSLFGDFILQLGKSPKAIDEKDAPPVDPKIHPLHRPERKV